MRDLELPDNQELVTLLQIEDLVSKLPDRSMYDEVHFALDALLTEVSILRIVDRYTKMAEDSYRLVNGQDEEADELALNDAAHSAEVATVLCSTTHPLVAKAFSIRGRILIRLGMKECGCAFLEKAVEQYKELGLEIERQDLQQNIRELLKQVP